MKSKPAVPLGMTHTSAGLETARCSVSGQLLVLAGCCYPEHLVMLVAHTRPLFEER